MLDGVTAHDSTIPLPYLLLCGIFQAKNVNDIGGKTLPVRRYPLVLDSIKKRDFIIEEHKEVKGFPDGLKSQPFIVIG